MNTLTLYSHPACRQHLAGTSHVEHPSRLDAVIEAISHAFPSLPWNPAPRATRAQLLRVHADVLLSRILDTGFGPGQAPMALDADTLIGPESAEAALRAAGAGIAAVDALAAGVARRAFCAVRPPGHHATGATAMGFCLLNNIAVAAAHACDRHRLQRVAVVDFDVHHGNGTAAIFRGDPRVMYLSSHEQGLYPATGAAGDHGIGNIVNRPLPAGTGGEGFRAAWREHLLPALDAFRPQLVLVSAGFDADARDPLANLRLVPADFGWLTDELVTIADHHAGGRLLSMLEGGYDLDTLREGATAHVRSLATESVARLR